MPNGYCDAHSGLEVRIKNTEDDVKESRNDISEIRGLMQRIYYALIGAALTFATAAIMLGLNLAIK
jgi:hypothetical protein